MEAWKKVSQDQDPRILSLIKSINPRGSVPSPLNCTYMCCLYTFFYLIFFLQQNLFLSLSIHTALWRSINIFCIFWSSVWSTWRCWDTTNDPIKKKQQKKHLTSWCTENMRRKPPKNRNWKLNNSVLYFSVSDMDWWTVPAVLLHGPLRKNTHPPY